MLDGDLQRLREGIPRFVELCDTTMWSRRIAHFHRELDASPFRAKLVADYHWLEVVLGSELEHVEGGDAAAPAATDALAALNFAQSVVHAHDHLTVTGQKQLEGRLYRALQSDTGFSSLYSRWTWQDACSTPATTLSSPTWIASPSTISDSGTAPSRARSNASLSTDVGRKIHRRVGGPVPAESISWTPLDLAPTNLDT